MSLINYLEKPEVRLLFGKQEIEIIKKQLLGLTLKPSEKTRLSRDIRKKLETIKEISKYKEEFKLKKSQEILFLLKESKEIILEELGQKVKEIILFGSHAKKENIKDSDIDLALKLKNTKTSPTSIRAKLSGRLDEKIDIQIYSSLPKKIQKEIDKFGKIIYKNGENQR